MIKVQVEELKNELDTLNGAICEFESYSTSFISTAIDSMDDMNSDFTDTMSETLDNMTDTKAPELMKKLQRYYTSVLALVNEFENTDNEISDQIKEGSK